MASTVLLGPQGVAILCILRSLLGPSEPRSVVLFVLFADHFNWFTGSHIGPRVVKSGLLVLLHPPSECLDVCL